MDKTQLVKQAYVRGLAARGILRRYSMLKYAADKPTPATPLNNTVLNKANQIAQGATDQANADESLKAYGLYGGVGAAAGGAIGALIQAARKKNILLGAGLGAGIGGTAGIGARVALNTLNESGVLNKNRIETAKDSVDKGMTVADQYMGDNSDEVKRIATLSGLGALSGGALGAAIQAARQKSIALGAGLGAGIGGTAGLAVGLAPNIVQWSKASKNKWAREIYDEDWDNLTPEQQQAVKEIRNSVREDTKALNKDVRAADQAAKQKEKDMKNSPEFNPIPGISMENIYEVNTDH